MSLAVRAFAALSLLWLAGCQTFQIGPDATAPLSAHAEVVPPKSPVADLITDPNAANTLPGVISRVRGRLASRPDLIGVLDQRLARAGWSASSADRYSQPYRVVAEELYRVDDAFPRLTRDSFPNGIPTGIDNIEYKLDLAACGPWRVAVHPEQATEILGALHE